MVKYKSRHNDSDKEMDKVVGGALGMLSQYDALAAGDEYSSKNPTDDFLNAPINQLQDLHKATRGGALFSKKNLMKAVGAMSPLAIHLLKKGARHIVNQKLKKGSAGRFLADAALDLAGAGLAGGAMDKGDASKTRPGDEDFTTKKGDKDFHRDGHLEHYAGGDLTSDQMGALDDISKVKDTNHLLNMVEKDQELSKMGGGSFLDDLGKVAQIGATVAPFLL
tara:strand:- start:1363 stop:2028 length:666 start_codon:yes stop_codon:yes gene_type:complete